MLALVWILGRTSGEEGVGRSAAGRGRVLDAVALDQPQRAADEVGGPYEGARLVVVDGEPLLAGGAPRSSTGAVVYMGTLPGGARKSFRDPQALYVRFGSPVGVRVKVNGGAAEALDATVAASYLVTRKGMKKI